VGYAFCKLILPTAALPEGGECALEFLAGKASFFSLGWLGWRLRHSDYGVF